MTTKATLKWRFSDSLLVASEPTAKMIADLVAEAFRMPVKLLRSHTNEHRISHPRQIAMWLLVNAGHSLPATGRILGGFHHTTVLYGVVKVEAAMGRDPELRKFIEALHRKACTRFDELQQERGA